MDKKLIEPASHTLMTIEAKLDELSNRIEGIGLYNGLMGICICYYILFDITQKNKYRKLAKGLLDRIQGSIPTIEDFGFGEGLAGIGWGVEWLVQNNFVKANTDEVLEELDDDLYAKVLYSKHTDLSISSGSTGQALYFLSRIQAKNHNRLKYKYVCNLECLVLLSDEISEKLLNEDDGIIFTNKKKIGDAELGDLAHILILMLLLKEKRINTEAVTQTIELIILFIEQFLIWHKKEKIIPEVKSGFFHLIFAYRLTAEIFGKENFSVDTLAVNQYLIELNDTFSKNSAPLKEILGRTIDLYVKHPGNDLLHLLKEINAIKNTAYGYEAFMLKFSH
jgi:hypothetical protein